jgi:hypothetical protein
MIHARRTFSPGDDEELRRLVSSFGDNNWGFVAQQMTAGFTSRQCRERWHNYLDPYLDHESWSDDDDRRLLDEFARVGPRWAAIAGCFAGRSGNSVRNRFFLLQRKARKKGGESEKRAAPPSLRVPLPARQCEAPRGPDPMQEKPNMFSLFNPENFTDLSHENIMSMFFPTV